MKVIREFKQKNRICFRYLEQYNDTVIINRVINVELVIIEVNDKKHYIIYHSDKSFDEDVYNFLNNSNHFSCENTQKSYAYSLKKLTVWEEIIQKRFTEFSVDDVQQFLYFLCGKTGNGAEIKLELISARNYETASDIIAHCAELYKKTKKIYFNGFNPFKEIDKRGKVYNNVKIKIGNEIDNVYATEAYKEIPKYISEQEMKTIVEVIKNRKLPKKIPKNEVNKKKISKYKKLIKRDLALVRLMYEGGLRIGEVLGLTLEDISLTENEKGEELGKIVIRNRFSDGEDQSAKTCMKIMDRNDYQKSIYQKEPRGRQVVYISDDLYYLIDDYISLAHKFAKKHQKENYQDSIADAVGIYKSYRKENHYIFLNFNGSRLSSANWNQHLRKIFLEADIPIDKGKRRNNLSHRFRHGFVMHLIALELKENNSINILRLMKRTRHTNIKSLLVYFNPRMTDIVLEKEEVESEILGELQNLDDLEKYLINKK